jgi:hypothetical protein
MKKFIIASAVMAMFATSAIAAEEAKDAKGKKPEGGKMFETFDANKDGGISKQEWQASHDKKFTDMDGNKDGKVVPDEARAFQLKQAEAHKNAASARSKEIAATKASQKAKATTEKKAAN